MEDWLTHKDSGCNKLKKWIATLNMGSELHFEVNFANITLNKICLACYAHLIINGEDGSVDKVASGGVMLVWYLVFKLSEWFGYFNSVNLYGEGKTLGNQLRNYPEVSLKVVLSPSLEPNLSKCKSDEQSQVP
ncbi:hypothetical protein GOBAR_AA39583 [Gossypium barbadense]|uniref:Uncharacterized protein n=1 Tax=Gossypium barbadense TaxID=3634 RepID=A0A2P5VQL5_GOSBA|nr:hypothetical protein GOBAR_AA39583 [Gossypium barbadense]